MSDLQRFEVYASDGEGAKEGPFVFDAASADAAAQRYREWAWGMVNRDAPAPLQTGGPLPHVTATLIA